MLLFGRLAASLSLAALVFSAFAAPEEEVMEPEIAVTAFFDESNPFGHVVNGEKNTLTLTVENKSNQNVTLVGVSGSFHHPDTNALIKNLTALKYGGVPLFEGVKLNLPYAFHSEFKPGDLRLHVWLEHSVDSTLYRVTAYDSVVTIVEPEVSIFDFKLITTYLMVAAILGGLSYFAYLTFVPQTKKTRVKRTTASSVSSPVSKVKASGAGGYQEEWIPEHHLKKTKSAKKAGKVASSGDELSGGETSGAEARRRKGRK